MARRIAQFISIALVAMAAGGCRPAPARGTPATAVSVLVGPVTIPAAVDQPEFVVQVAANRVDVDEFNRWVAPLGDGIARAAAGDLGVLLGTPQVATQQLANFNPDYRVTIDGRQFDSMRGTAAFIRAVWTVRRTSKGETRSGRTDAREPVQ